MSRTYKLSTPDQTLSKRFVLILHENDFPMGTGVERDKAPIDRMIAEWLSGKPAHSIAGIEPNRRSA